jgi:hypothetical protein
VIPKFANSQNTDLSFQLMRLLHPNLRAPVDLKGRHADLVGGDFVDARPLASEFDR